MSCSKILDMFYEYSGTDSGYDDSMPLLDQLQVWFHTLLCQNCAREIQRYEDARTVMREDFFPYSSNLDSTNLDSLNLEELIMTKIANDEQLETESSYAIPGGISTRGWIIAGLIILVSMVTAFFGFDFKNVAQELGMSFMLPMGITIGIVLTTYCAFFIGSHLKEFSERFGL